MWTTIWRYHFENFIECFFVHTQIQKHADHVSSLNEKLFEVWQDDKKLFRLLIMEWSSMELVT